MTVITRTPNYPTDDAAAVLANASAALHVDGKPVPRETALSVLRRQLVRIQADVRDAFETEKISGLNAARRLGGLTDGVIGALYTYATEVVGQTDTDRLVVAATGGYGRGVLAPFSDIDLLFLTQDQPDPKTLQVVEYMLYFLWDLGLKVGHATRSIDDCLTEATGDHTVRTSLLDSRPIVGNSTLYEDFQTRFRTDCTDAGGSAFISAKQSERAQRHKRFGDSPYVVEPNIKEGRGGLRDIQTLYWVSRYLFDTQVMMELADPDGPAGSLILPSEAYAIRRAWSFLWTVRFHLHYVAGRAEERLTFDLQPVIGARMGYTRHGRQGGVERFMRHYFLTVRDVSRLTQVLEPALLRAASGPPAVAPEADIALAESGFVLADGMLMSAQGREFHREPIQMFRALRIARDRNLALHPLALRALIRSARLAMNLRDNAEASAIFLDLLSRPDSAKWLRLLNETGVLGRFLPDWARIVGQMQFDTYHVFTVDEHTIEAIRVLNTMDRGELSEVAPIASSLIGQIQSRRALYAAALLHDIAKGRGGDHSELGAEVAQEVGPQLGLTPEETETVSWLVLHHLLLSQTAFKRDIDDPKTILDLADVIQSPERLRLLLVLTVADMRAVSPKVWNAWKATLLRELYHRVIEVLAGGLSTTVRDTRVARAREQVGSMLVGWSDTDKDWFLNLGYPSYWLAFDPETHARHAAMARDANARNAPLTVHAEPLPDRGVTEITVYADDHAGLFSRIAGALAVANVSIVDARIHTMTNGMALDTFWVQDTSGTTLEAPHRLARISALIEQALSGQLKLDHEMQKISKHYFGRMRAIHVPPRVVIDNHASNTHTVVEVNGRDRPGLLHDVTAAISASGLQIASAHVTTYGVRAVDVFYVKDVFGLKVENDRKLAQLRETLLAALAVPENLIPTDNTSPPSG